MSAATPVVVFRAGAHLVFNRPSAPIMRPRTPAEIVDALARGFLQGVLDNVHRYEAEQAAIAAAAASTPIQVDP